MPVPWLILYVRHSKSWPFWSPLLLVTPALACNFSSGLGWRLLRRSQPALPALFASPTALPATNLATIPPTVIPPAPSDCIADFTPL